MEPLSMKPGRVVNNKTVEVPDQKQEGLRQPGAGGDRASKQLIRYLIPVLYLLGDTAGVFASFLLAYELRFFSGLAKIFPVTLGIPPLSPYLHALVFVSAVWVFIFAVFGHYRERSPSLFDRFYETARGVSSGTFIVLATTFFYRGDSFSRLVLTLAWAISILLIWAVREVLYRFELWYLRRGIMAKRAVLVGGEKQGLELFEKFDSQPALGTIPVGFVADSSQKVLPESKFPCLGTIGELDRVVKSWGIDVVVFNLPREQQDFMVDFAMRTNDLKLEYMTTPDILGLLTFSAKTGHIDGIPVLRWGTTALRGYASLVKRLFDIVLSGVGIVLLSPLFAIIAAAVKLDSRGPILFRQRRVGQNGRDFVIYKFRSMRYDENNRDGLGWTVKNDSRRTKVGNFIRRYSLDELPQLFNVLLGQMSLVGPRPEQVGFVEKFKTSIPRYFHRHKIKCGMTGWAQVNGLRGDTSIEERTKYDLYYIENWSLIFDIKIILLTLKNIFRSPNAY